MAISSPISQRIAMLRTTMIFGVVLLHTPGELGVDQIDFHNAFHVIRAFFQEAVFRATVPLLSLISGYLLFSAGLDLAPVKLYKKKLKTLAIPFFFFNVMLAVLMYGIEMATGWAPWYQMGRMSQMELVNGFYAVTAYPFNFPLYFIRDLLVVTLLVPLFGLFIRHAPVIGLAAVAAIFYGDLDGSLVLRFSIPVFVYVGGLAAVYKWDLSAADRHALPCFAVFLCGAAAIVAFRITDIDWFVFTAPFLVWPAASRLVATRYGKWAQANSNSSFFIFCAHAPLQMVPYHFYRHHPDSMPEALYWFGSFALCIAALLAAHRLAMRTMPKVFGFMTATRLSRPAQARSAVDKRDAKVTA